MLREFILDFLWRVIMIFVLRVASGFNVRALGKTLANSHLTLIFHPVMMILTDFTIQSDFTMFFIKVAQPHQPQLMVRHFTHESSMPGPSAAEGSPWEDSGGEAFGR